VTGPGRFGAITVLGASTPHTTPIATIRHGGRWWFTTSRHAAKIAMLRRHPIASLTIPARTEGVDHVDPTSTTVTGRATLIDLADPASLLRSPAATTAALPAVVRLLGEHATDLAGYLADARELPREWSPIGRLLVAVEEEVVEHHPAPTPDPDREAAPDEVIEAVACVVGVRTGGVPCGVAGTFDGLQVRVGPLARPVDLDGGIAVMIDGATVDGATVDDGPSRPSRTTRPSVQHGILVRGRIDDLQHIDDGTGDHSIVVTARSITRWSGFESSTQRFDPAAA
jgi:hypothetical protein